MGIGTRTERGMKDIVVSYFTKLFSSSGVDNFDSILCHIMPKVTEEMNIVLECPFTDEEIKCAVFQMHPTKAPGPDGMSPGFYQKHWDVVGAGCL